jgi:hypothetical protein
VQRFGRGQKPYESVLKESWDEGERSRRHTERQRRRQAIRRALHVFAFSLGAAVAAVVVAAFIDNLARGGDRHGREIVWWLVMYGVSCGAAAYSLFADWESTGKPAVDSDHASSAVLLVPLFGGYLLMIALALDAVSRSVLVRLGVL